MGTEKTQAELIANLASSYEVEEVEEALEAGWLEVKGGEFIVTDEGMDYAGPQLEDGHQPPFMNVAANAQDVPHMLVWDLDEFDR